MALNECCIVEPEVFVIVPPNAAEYRNENERFVTFPPESVAEIIGEYVPFVLDDGVPLTNPDELTETPVGKDPDTRA